MDVQESEKLFREASALFKDGKLKESLKILDKLYRAYPKDKEILFAAAMCLGKLGQHEEAISLCDQLIEMYQHVPAKNLRVSLEKEKMDSSFSSYPGMDVDNLLNQNIQGMDNINFPSHGPAIPGVPEDIFDSKRHEPVQVKGMGLSTTTLIIGGTLLVLLAFVLGVGLTFYLVSGSANQTATAVAKHSGPIISADNVALVFKHTVARLGETGAYILAAVLAYVFATLGTFLCLRMSQRFEDVPLLLTVLDTILYVLVLFVCFLPFPVTWFIIRPWAHEFVLQQRILTDGLCLAPVIGYPLGIVIFYRHYDFNPLEFIVFLGLEAVTLLVCSLLVFLMLSAAGSRLPEAPVIAVETLTEQTEAAPAAATPEATPAADENAEYVTTWEVSKRYEKPGKSGFDLFNEKFSPEVDGGSDAQWKPMPAGTDPAKPYLLQLDKALEGGENCVAYLRCKVYMDPAQDAVLGIGSDDGVKVWVNDSLVDEVNSPRPCTPNEDTSFAPLLPGWNNILMKVINGSSKWEACLRIRDRQNQPFPTPLKTEAGVAQ